MGWSNGKDKLIPSLKLLTHILGYFMYCKLVTSQGCHLLHHCCLGLLGTFSWKIPSEQGFHWFLFNLRYNVYHVGLILLYCNITTVALTCLSCHTIIISYCFKIFPLWKYFFSQSDSIFFFESFLYFPSPMELYNIWSLVTDFFDLEYCFQTSSTL